jgi:membrane protease YdiL (CAAX protease family)
MKPRLLLILEFLLLIAGLVAYALGYLAFPILPLVLVAWASLRMRHMRWRDVGLKRPASWMRTIVIALLIGIVYQALDILLIAPLLQKLTGETIDLSQFDALQGNLVLLIISLGIAWTLAAFIEELFFRGYLLNRSLDLFGRGRSGMITALVINMLIFGTAHYYQGISGVIDTAIAGALLAYLYFKSGQNLWLPILTHGVIDTIAFVLIYLGRYP